VNPFHIGVVDGMAKIALRGLASQEEIFSQASQKFGGNLPKRVRHGSGGLADARGTSDVDMTVHSLRPESLAKHMPEGTTSDTTPERTIYSVPGYERQVNLWAGPKRSRAMRSVRHREVHLALERTYPHLATEARKLKAQGMPTERAWHKVLQLHGDPYEDLMNMEMSMAAAKRVSGGRR